MGLNDTFWTNHVILTGWKARIRINTQICTRMRFEQTHMDSEIPCRGTYVHTLDHYNINNIHNLSNHRKNRLYWDKKDHWQTRVWMWKQLRQKEREREGVYLQGRGGGTPKSAKSGSENRAKEGWGHSFLIHDYKSRILTEAKTTRCNNVLRFLQRKLQIVDIPKWFWHPWMLHHSLSSSQLCKRNELL